MEKVSIIIPVYNAVKYINECLESIVKQTYTNLEIIIVNDGSTDDSLAVCQKWEREDKRIKVYDNTNHGVSYTRNFGIERSTGKYLAFVDSDDVIDKEYVKILLDNIIDSKADCSICGIDKGTEYTIQESHEEYNIFCDDKLLGLFKIYGGFLWNKLYKREIILKYGIKLNEKVHISEDLLFNFEYFTKCNSVVYNDSKLYFYRIYTQSSYNNPKNIKWFSVLDTYSILFNKYSATLKETRSDIIYMYWFNIYEAQHRIRKIEKTHVNEIMEKIDISKNELKGTKKELAYIQRIKLFVFHNLKFLVDIYRIIKRKCRG